MDFKNLIPFLTAAAGAGASYYFLGREKKGDKRVPREGLEPWATAVGGALVGYVAGQFVASKIQPPPPPALPKNVETAAQRGEQYVDLDGQPARPLALPAPQAQIPVPTAAIQPDTRADGANDAELLNGLGTFAGTGEDGMGSYEGAYGDVDGIDVEALMRESERN